MPIIFPMPSGEVMLEWDILKYSPSLTVNLNWKTGYWHVLNPDDENSVALGLDLSCDDTWDWLAMEIQKYSKLTISLDI